MQQERYSPHYYYYQCTFDHEKQPFLLWEKMTKRNAFKLFFKIHYTSELIRREPNFFVACVRKTAILEKLRFEFLQMIGF